MVRVGLRVDRGGLRVITIVRVGVRVVRVHREVRVDTVDRVIRGDRVHRRDRGVRGASVGNRGVILVPESTEWDSEWSERDSEWLQ